MVQAPSSEVQSGSHRQSLAQLHLQNLLDRVEVESTLTANTTLVLMSSSDLPTSRARRKTAQPPMDRPINITVNGNQISVTPENIGIAMFRHEPELDYIDIHEPVEGTDDERHTVIFNQRELLLWMGHICLKDNDIKTVRLAERKLGSFTLQSGGWRPPVFIEDHASEWEKEMYVQSLMVEDLHADLNKALGEEFED